MKGEVREGDGNEKKYSKRVDAGLVLVVRWEREKREGDGW